MHKAILISGWIVLGYFSGALVWGYWISRFLYGTDIRRHGSGNIGATNVFRVLGPVPGILTFLLDILKGFVPVYFAQHIAGAGISHFFPVAVGCAAIVGHTFPIFLKGKGGKAVSCSFGVLLALFPVAASVALMVWLAVFLASGYVSLGSIAAAVALPIFVRFYGSDTLLVIVACAICVLVIWAHRANLKRLASGTENRMNIWKRLR
jgi:glycerol-3-phosphate acyltransferase PlsY